MTFNFFLVILKMKVLYYITKNYAVLRRAQNVFVRLYTGIKQT